MTRKRTPRAGKPRDHVEDGLTGRLKALKPRLEAPSEAAVRRWSTVPLVFAQSPPPNQRTGQVVYDGWKEGGVALRDATTGHTRRLTLGAGSVLLDLVAWREEQGWRFVARARSGEQTCHDFVLKTGRHRLLPQAGGFFQWRSRGVPRALELWSRNKRIVFESIAWT